MSGHRPYSDLTADWSPERRERAAALRRALDAEIDAEAHRDADGEQTKPEAPEK